VGYVSEPFTNRALKQANFLPHLKPEKNQKPKKTSSSNVTLGPRSIPHLKLIRLLVKIAISGGDN
jgi:hypothetical protein